MSRPKGSASTVCCPKCAHRFTLTQEIRFWGKVDKDGPNGCWLWTGAKFSNGYGCITLDRDEEGWHHTTTPHRFAYELVVGPVPEGLVLDHLCRNKGCCNPAHVEPVTQKVNVHRAGGAPKTHCKRGHEWTPENTRITRNGTRNCRACAAFRERQKRVARKTAT